MLKTSLFKRVIYKNKINYSTSPSSTSNSFVSSDNSNNNTSNPPSFFHNEENLPKKLEEINSLNNLPPKSHFNSATTTATSNTSNSDSIPLVSAPKALFSNISLPIPHSQPLSLPTSSANVTTEGITSTTSSSPPASSSVDTSNYFRSYKDFCMGMAYLGIGTGVIFFIFDQHERLDESERQMTMMKKKQKELVVQMQNYKNKLSKIAVENAKKNVMLQGKMQMHIALLREQLLDIGIDPVTIDIAIDKFEQEVKIDIASNTVELWVPGESKLKSLIPDPHEYTKKK